MCIVIEVCYENTKKKYRAIKGLTPPHSNLMAVGPLKKKFEKKLFSGAPVLRARPFIFLQIPF